MRKAMNQSGKLDILILPLILSLLVVIGLAVFGFWAYSNFTTQRDDVDAIVAEEVDRAKADQKVELQADFEEKEKKPLRTYTSPSSAGSVSIKYPKTWSVYMEEGTSSLEGWFQPNFVPAINSDTSFALRVQVDNSTYSEEVSRLDRLIEDGTIKATPIRIAKVNGVRLDGFVAREKSGAMVMFPIRDKTLRVWTESDKFVKDFNTIILKHLSFIP